MIWALNQKDPNNVLYSQRPEMYPEMLAFIKKNDNEFVDALNKYKEAEHYHVNNEANHRQQCEPCLAHIE